MKKIKMKEEVLIEELDIKENLKKELLYFKDKIKEIIKKEGTINVDILIDDLSQSDINILLEYTTEILKQYDIFDEFINFEDMRRKYENYKNSVIVINNFAYFEDEILDRWCGKKELKKFISAIKSNNNILIITCPCKIEKYFDKIENIYFDKDICIHLTNRIDKREEYKKLIQKYKEKNINCKLYYSNFKEMYDELEKSYYVKKYNIVDYIYDYSIKKITIENKNIINKQTFEPFLKKEDKTKSPKPQKIENLIGLENIKKQLKTLYNYIEFIKKAKIKDNIYLNLFFLGNPGTGKTTVARMYASKLYKLGYIKKDEIVEVVPNDLIGEYVGHTKRKTEEILEKAKDCLLFIDEAYLLYNNNYSSGNNPFMEEAIVELIKYLEDPSHIVIFAGYPNEMRKIYNTNPGLKSRIYSEIMFDDYSKEQLYEILVLNIKEKGLEIDSKSKEKIKNYIEEIKKEKNFGNARSMKQLTQKMIMNHVNIKDKNNLKLDYKDLPKLEKKTNLKMGFDAYDGR